MPASSKEYRVVCAGLNYRLPGAEHATEFALHGANIDLDADEAKRLIDLDAVVAKGDPDPVALLEASPNPDNPYGGVPMIDPVAHAEAAAKAAVTKQAAPGDKPDDEK